MKLSTFLAGLQQTKLTSSRAFYKPRSYLCSFELYKQYASIHYAKDPHTSISNDFAS